MGTVLRNDGQSWMWKRVWEILYYDVDDAQGAHENGASYPGITEYDAVGLRTGASLVDWEGGEGSMYVACPNIIPSSIDISTFPEDPTMMTRGKTEKPPSSEHCQPSHSASSKMEV